MLWAAASAGAAASDDGEEGAAHHACARPARSLRASCITRSCVRVVRASAMRSQVKKGPASKGAL